jgi:hypothetical protein
MLALKDTLLKLPVEAQAWINGLNPVAQVAAEYVLNIVGEDNFIANWQTHRDAQQKAWHDYAH